MFDREKTTLDREFGGIASLEGTPGAIVLVDPREEHIAAKEAKKMKVETVGLLNSDCDMNSVTLPILANDAALLSVKYFLEGTLTYC